MSTTHGPFQGPPYVHHRDSKPEPISAAEMAQIIRNALHYGMSLDLSDGPPGSSFRYLTLATEQTFRVTITEEPGHMLSESGQLERLAAAAASIALQARLDAALAGVPEWIRLGFEGIAETCEALRGEAEVLAGLLSGGDPPEYQRPE